MEWVHICKLCKALGQITIVEEKDFQEHLKKHDPSIFFEPTPKYKW